MASSESAEQKSKYYRIQGLTRGLAILCALNELPGGAGSILQIARLTSLHRTTAKRILETLRTCGFVRHVPGSNHYSLTFRVRKLSGGFHDEEWISEGAMPLMRELTSKVLWPSDIVTLEGDELIIRESTHPFSPLSFHRSMVGERLPLLETAAGRAYLAFCPEREREALLDLLRTRSDRQGERARNIRAVKVMLEETRRRGYAVNRGDRANQERFGAIAVPIMRGRRVFACLNIIFSRRVIQPEQAAERYLYALRSTAVRIARVGRRTSEA